MYFLSQFCAIISTVFLGFSFFANSKRKIMILCLFYCVFYGIHYLFLGAITGVVMIFISLVRNVWFFWVSKRKINSCFSLVLFVFLGIIGMVFTYKNFLSIISMLGNLISTYSVWQSSVFKYRVLAIFVSTCFLIYSIGIGSLFAIITEIILLVFEFISVFKYRKCGFV